MQRRFWPPFAIRPFGGRGPSQRRGKEKSEEEGKVNYFSEDNVGGNSELTVSTVVGHDYR